MLTNCKNCQYFRRNNCLANPDYCEGFKFFDNQKNTMSQVQKDALNAIAKPCEKFFKSENLEIRSQSVALTIRTWVEVAQQVEEIVNLNKDDCEEWLPLLEAAKKAIKGN